MDNQSQDKNTPTSDSLSAFNPQQVSPAPPQPLPVPEIQQSQVFTTNPADIPTTDQYQTVSPISSTSINPAPPTDQQLSPQNNSPTDLVDTVQAPDISLASPSQPTAIPSFQAPIQNPSLAVQPMPANLQTPSLDKAYLDQTRPGITFGVLSIIFALLIPLIGAVVALILGVVSIIKGFGSKNKNIALGVLGIVSIPIAIIATIAWIAIGMNVFYAKYDKTLTYSNTFNNVAYSFDYPEQMTEKQESDDTNTVVLRHKIGDANSSMIVFAAESTLGTPTDSFMKILSSESGDKSVELLIKRSDKDASNVSNLRVYGNKEVSANGMRGITKEISFTSVSSATNTSGRIIILIDDQNFMVYTMLILAEQNIWEKNTDMWQRVQDSIKDSDR